MSSKNMVQETAAEIPILRSGAARTKPGVVVGTTNTEMPFARGAVGHGEEDDGVGHRAVGDPVLAAVDEVAVALLHRGGLCAAASEPAPRARSARSTPASPRAKGTRNSCFWASVPNFSTGSQ
jgi:hypothetical protein